MIIFKSAFYATISIANSNLKHNLNPSLNPSLCASANRNVFLHGNSNFVIGSWKLESTTDEVIGDSSTGILRVAPNFKRSTRCNVHFTRISHLGPLKLLKRMDGVVVRMQDRDFLRWTSKWLVKASLFGIGLDVPVKSTPPITGHASRASRVEFSLVNRDTMLAIVSDTRYLFTRCVVPEDDLVALPLYTFLLSTILGHTYNGVQRFLETVVMKHH